MIKSLLYLALMTTALVISWVGFSIHHSYTTTTIAPDTRIRITPIPGEFNRTTIEKIKQKDVIETDLKSGRAIETISQPDDEEEQQISTSSGVTTSSASGQTNL